LILAGLFSSAFVMMATMKMIHGCLVLGIDNGRIWSANIRLGFTGDGGPGIGFAGM
jgi:hypothetical protein